MCTSIEFQEQLEVLMTKVFFLAAGYVPIHQLSKIINKDRENRIPALVEFTQRNSTMELTLACIVTANLVNVSPVIIEISNDLKNEMTDEEIQKLASYGVVIER